MSYPALVFRLVKGSNLTAAEHDGNWTNVDTRLTAIESQGLTAERVASTVQDGFVVSLVGSKGSSLGSFTIPTFVLRDAWETETEYSVLDIVSHEGASYICVEDHESGDFTTDYETSGVWQLHSAKGDSAVTVNWTGVYNALTTYSQGDGVTYNRVGYYALQETTGDTPGESGSEDYWKPLEEEVTQTANVQAALFMALFLGA